MFKIFLVVFCAVLLTSVGMLLGQSPDSTLHLPDLIEEALQNNPGIQASYHSWKAAQAKISQAGALPDPTLNFNLLNLPVESFVFDQEPMSGKQIAVMQMFPFPGKLGLKEKIAAESANVSEARLQEIRNQLVKEVKAAYFNLFFVDKAIETTRKNTSLVRDFVKIAETKYSVGKGLQQDVLKAQVELSKMQDNLITLQQKREALEAKLNALLNRPAENPLGKTPELQPADFSFSLTELKAFADQNRPLFWAWQAMERQSNQKVKLAKKGYLPDFKIAAAYTQRDVLQSGKGGADFVSGLFSVNIPLYFWKKQRKNVEETRFTQTAVQRNFQNARNQVYAGLEKTLSAVEKDKRLLDLYQNGIIPQASQSLNSAISGYQTDKVDFLTMLSNQMTLFNYQLDYYRILSDYHIGIAELEALTGKRFSEKEKE